MSVGSTVTAIAFWLATVLPVLYLPVILAGLDSAIRLGLFGCLLAINVVALVVGHDYPESRPN
ncbi:hypothetical protein ACYJ1Y_14955 [Natrialbaceae archaeon A-gly3]